MGSSIMKSLALISGFIFSIFSCTISGGLVLPPDNPSDGGEDNWADLADTLLCAGNTAMEIRDGLIAVWPNYHWFVLVQDADDLCGKNMVVWMYSGGIKPCNENVAGTLAQQLIDDAVSSFPFPEDILDFIKTNEASYSLTHYFTISWMTGSDISASTALSCKVENSQAWYLIKTGPSELRDNNKDF